MEAKVETKVAPFVTQVLLQRGAAYCARAEDLQRKEQGGANALVPKRHPASSASPHAALPLLKVVLRPFCCRCPLMQGVQRLREMSLGKLVRSVTICHL
eukprot:978981-Amphidinium_carterae.1